MKKVYLSGGFVTNWQDELIDNMPNIIFYDPRKLGIDGLPRLPPSIYAPMDKKMIEDCDIVFAYLEADNPTPINIIAELCYAKGLGKTTIFCVEWTQQNIQKLRTLKPNGDWFKPHYLDMVIFWMDFVFTDFGQAKQLLSILAKK